MATRRIARRTTSTTRHIARREPISHNYKFTRLVRTVVYRALEARLPVSRAVELAGISFVTYREWMKRGATGEEPIYTAFRRKVKTLQAQHEKNSLAIIDKIARGGYKVTETKVTLDPKGQTISRKRSEALPKWQAAAWFLERRHKEDYGRDPIDPLSKKTPSEIAAEIKEAADDLFNSVPNAPEDDALQEAIDDLNE